MQTANDPFIHQSTMRDIFLVLFKHKFKIVVFFLVIISTVGMSALLLPKVYESEAKLFIKLGKEVVTQNAADRPDQRIQVSQSMENQMNSEIEILTSQELSQKVVATIGADAFQEGTEKYSSLEDPVIVALRLQISKLFEFPKNAVAQLLKSTAPPETGTNPKGNQASSGLITQNLKASVVNASNIITLDYDTRDPYLARDVLDQLINLYLEKHIKIVGTQGTLDFFKKESDRFLQQLEVTEKKLAGLKNAAGSEFASSEAADLLRVLNNLKQQEQELLSTFTENSIPVKEIRRQISIAESNLQKRIQKNNTATVRIAQLEREKELIDATYRKYMASMEQTRIDQALEEGKISNIRVIQAPTVQMDPVRPNTRLILLMGLLLAVSGSLGIAFFAEYMDNSLERPEQIEGVLHLPVLGSIQKMEK